MNKCFSIQDIKEIILNRISCKIYVYVILDDGSYDLCILNIPIKFKENFLKTFPDRILNKFDLLEFNNFYKIKTTLKGLIIDI